MGLAYFATADLDSNELVDLFREPGSRVLKDEHKLVSRTGIEPNVKVRQALSTPTVLVAGEEVVWTSTHNLGPKRTQGRSSSRSSQFASN